MGFSLAKQPFLLNNLYTLILAYCALSEMLVFNCSFVNSLKSVGKKLSTPSLSSDKILCRITEMELRDRGFQYVIGTDEAGRGPLAGPVVIASVISLNQASVIQVSIEYDNICAR